jgi:hypothetical protein
VGDGAVLVARVGADEGSDAVLRSDRGEKRNEKRRRSMEKRGGIPRSRRWEEAALLGSRDLCPLRERWEKRSKEGRERRERGYRSQCRWRGEAD